jgi:hypothetical protein
MERKHNSPLVIFITGFKRLKVTSVSLGKLREGEKGGLLVPDYGNAMLRAAHRRILRS